MAEEEKTAGAAEEGAPAGESENKVDVGELQRQMQELQQSFESTKAALAASDRKVTELTAEKAKREKEGQTVAQRIEALEQERERERLSRVAVQQLAAAGLPASDDIVKVMIDGTVNERIELMAKLAKDKEEAGKQQGTKETTEELYKNAERKPDKGGSGQESDDAFFTRYAKEYPMANQEKKESLNKEKNRRLAERKTQGV